MKSIAKDTEARNGKCIPICQCCLCGDLLRLRSSLVIGGKVKKELCCLTGISRPFVTKRSVTVCGRIEVDQSFGLANNVLSKRRGIGEQQRVTFFQLVAGSFNGLHGSRDPFDLILHIRKNEVSVSTNYRAKGCDRSLSFMDVGVKRDLRSQCIVLGFAMTRFRLFESKSESKPSCCRRGDGRPSIPIDYTRSAEQPALAHSIHHAHPELHSWCGRHSATALVPSAATHG